MAYPSNQPPHREGDAAAGIDVTDAFERFSQIDDVFTRAFWDERVRSKQTDAFFASYRMEAVPRRGAGFTQKEFALRNGQNLMFCEDAARKVKMGLEGMERFADLTFKTELSNVRVQPLSHRLASITVRNGLPSTSRESRASVVA